LRIRAIQEPVFSVANADFEGGDDDHGYGDCIFLVIYAQPSHVAAAASKIGCYRSGDKDLLATHKRRAEGLCETLKTHLDKLIAAGKSVLLVNQTNYSVILENEKLREEIVPIQKLHLEQLKENQHEASLMVVAEVHDAIKNMVVPRKAAIETIESKRYNPDVESLSVNHDS
jgi:hypothetical protein